MALENLRKRMGPTTKAVGYLDSVMAAELLHRPTGRRRRANGAKITSLNDWGYFSYCSIADRRNLYSNGIAYDSIC